MKAVSIHPVYCRGYVCCVDCVFVAGYVPDSMYTATQTLVLSGPPDDQLDDENDPFTSTNTEVSYQ